MKTTLKSFASGDEAFQYLANLYGIHSGKSCKETIQNIRNNIQNVHSFDFNSILGVVKSSDENFMHDMKFMCRKVFEGIKLPDKMEFIGLNEYIQVLGTPFSNNTFGSGDLSITVHGGNIENYARCWGLFSDCNLSALDNLNIKVSGFADLHYMFYKCSLPANSNIRIDIFPKDQCVVPIFSNTVFTGKTTIDLNICLKNQSYSSKDNFSGSVFSLFSDCNIPEYVSICSSGIHMLEGLTPIGGYLGDCNIGNNFRSPIVVRDDNDLCIWFRNINNMGMDIIPFMGATVSGKSLYRMCGLDGFADIDIHKREVTVSRCNDEGVYDTVVTTNDCLSDHKKELEELGCVFDMKKHVMHLPKSFNKAFQMLHDGSFVS